MAARKPDCHPNRKHAGHGLCQKCYQREWLKKDTDSSKRAREYNKQNSKRWYHANKELASIRNAAYRYGISEDEVKALRAKPCQICGSGENLHIDHDHMSGVVRGVLCRTCNLLLGHIEMHKVIKVDELLFRISTYLKLNGK